MQDLRHVLDFLKRELGEELTPEAGAQVYPALFNHVHPLAIGALEQSWTLSIQVAKQALSTHMDPVTEADAIDKIVDRLSDYYKSHMYQLNRREARELGLKVTNAEPSTMEAMWSLHQQLGQIGVQATGEVLGEPSVSFAVGFVASSKGLTIGLAHAKAAKPAEVVAVTWESKMAEEEETDPSEEPAQPPADDVPPEAQ